MKKPIQQILLVISFSFASLQGHAAGFQELTISGPNQTDLTVGVWYPSNVPNPSEPNTPFGKALALEAPVNNSNGRLIVISHGYSGWYAGHANQAELLANAGYIVAAPSHAGNTFTDMSATVDQWAINRPRQISSTVDGVLEHERFGEHIDPEQIGIYGFSAGGYTATALIGGTPDLHMAKLHCQQDPSEFVCEQNWVSDMIEANMDELPDSAWGKDERIRAAAIAAPGFAFAFTDQSLANITADVQLWSGELDFSVPTETNAANLQKNLPIEPESHWVEGANHFAFMLMPCRDEFKREDPQEYAMVCSDAMGFDRVKFHEAMTVEMIRFFDQALGVNG